MQTFGDYWTNFKNFFTLQQSIKAIPRRITNPVTTDIPPAGRYAYYFQASEESRARLALQTSWSFAALNRIGLAALPSNLIIKRRVGEGTEDIKNHPIEILAKRPNPDISREYLWMDTITNMHLKAAYWFLYPNSNGDIGEIWPMPFSRVRPIPDESPKPTRLFGGFIYRFRDGKELVIPPENVVYLRFPNPFDPYDSWPPLRALMKPIVTDNAQSDWNTTLYDENAGMPAVIVSVPESMTDDQVETVRRDLRDNVGKRMVARAGTVNVGFLQETHQEMQFLDGRESNKNEIYDVLGVPMDISNQDSYRWFINNTVWPVLQMIAGQITTQLTAPFFGDDIFAEFEDIRPQDRSLDVQESVQYAPFRSYNEERNTRGEPALPEIIIPDYIDGPFVGLSLYDDIPSRLVDQIMALILKGKPAPIPEQLQGFAGPPSMPGTAGATHDAVTNEAQTNPDMQQAQADATTPDAAQTAKAIIEPDKAIKAAFDSWQKIAIKKLDKGKSPAHVFFDDWISEHESYTLAAVLGHCQNETAIKAVFDHLDEYLKAEIGATSDVPQSQLDQEQEFIGPIQDWLKEQSKRITQNTSGGQEPPQTFWDRENELLTAFLVIYVAAWVEAGIAETVVSASAIGIGIDATVNARAAEWAGQYALDMAKGLNATTRELAKAKIKQWITTRGTMTELEASLGEIISPQWRASLIAQTEVTRAYAMASAEIARELGVEKGLHWRTRADERVCPFCSANDGKLTSRVGLPPAHPRCRCGTVMVL